jgi:phosphoribosylformimino-5-aminoimidazole carboxamide ribotide isomerase
MSEELIIYPAIDLMDGKVVRLKQGQFDKKTDYSDDPLAVAQHWKSQKAQWLHIVDLDGAKTGDMKNIDVVKKIAKNVNISIQVGGGVRSVERIKELIDNGIKRVVLGTKAIGDDNLMKEVVKKYLDSIAVSVDCSQGLVTQRGWVETTKIMGTDFAKQMEFQGIKCLIYTDIHKDGMLQGPNLAAIKEILKAVNIDVIASGGISGTHDIIELCRLKEQHSNLLGAITGKAIYELQYFDVKAAIDTVKNYKILKDKDMKDAQ